MVLYLINRSHNVKWEIDQGDLMHRKSRAFNFTLIFTFLLVIIYTGCTTDEITEDTGYYYTKPVQKNDGWDISTPDSEGLDIGIIENLLELIANNHYKNIHNLLIVKNRKLILDESYKAHLTIVDSYVDNRDIEVHAMMSVTKSIVSILTGIAIEKNIITGTDDNIYSYFPEYKSFENWNKKKSGITIRNFLTMRHGLSWDETSYKYTDPMNTYNQMEKVDDWVKFTLDRELVSEPGETFAYSTGASHTMEALISNASGITFPDFADKFLFGKLGITKRAWYKAPNGRADDVYLTVRDMAKFGQLVLDNGRWKGIQVVPETWIEESTARILNVSDDYGYGYFWWHHVFNVKGGEFPVVLAWGYGGQFIFIFPKLNMVVCFTSGNYTTGLSMQPFEMIRDYILPSDIK